METYKRNAVFSELKKYDYFARDEDYIEVTKWKNGEGYDIDINGRQQCRFQLTNGEYKALKKLIKKLG